MNAPTIKPWTKNELLRILNTPLSTEGKCALLRREAEAGVKLYKAAVHAAGDAAAVPGSADDDKTLNEVLARLDVLAAGLEKLLKAVERAEAESGIAA